MYKISKSELRHHYRSVRRRLLTSQNLNSYHSKLQQNLYKVLSSYWLSSNQSFFTGSLISSSQKSLKMKTQNQLLIGSYINRPIFQLIPPMPTIQKNYNIKYRYAFPYFSNHSRQMKFYEHFSKSSYKIGPFGVKLCNITQQQENLAEKLDVCLVPLVCFTTNKYRVGEGGGYYDHFIHRARVACKNGKNKGILFVGIGIQGLKINDKYDVKFDEWDQKLDVIITQDKIY